jgi:diguanylate cyclase (GGDEF)-like protein
MDNFFRDNEVKIDSVSGAYTQETLSAYASHLVGKKTPFSYVVIDVDNFTYITDAFGLDVGKKVLYDVAEKITEIVQYKGVLARNEGDEFSLILKNVVDYEEIWSICHTILVKINEISIPEIDRQTLTVTIGIARYPENGSNLDDLLTCSAKALYRGKTKGRNCFIIYLPEKHENIIPKDEKKRLIGSMNLHSNIFKFLTESDNLAQGITSLINFISAYFEIDHICIQSNEKLFFQKIHQLSKNQHFLPIPQELISKSINKLTGVLYISDRKNLFQAKHMELFELCESQQITASCICEISYREEHFGILRAEMTGTEDENRQWQYSDLDLLLTAAKTIGLILHYSGKTFEDLQ